MASYFHDTLLAAHKHSIFHKDEVLRSTICGCFYCLSNFDPIDILEWVDNDNPKGMTALCPKCTIDAVIGSASGYSVKELTFLVAMHKLWF